MSKKQYSYGMHSTTALLKNEPHRIVRLYIQETRDEKINQLIGLAKQHAIPIEYATRVHLDKITAGGNHQGIVAFCEAAKIYTESDIEALLERAESLPLILVLDGLQDPHNLGACFRTADAAGVTAIIAPKDKSVGITPVVNKVASGAAETIPFIQVTNLVRALETLKSLGVWIYGTDGAATQSIYQTDLRLPLALILGAEGKGLRRLTQAHCDLLVSIPMLGSVSSLNVSVAAGICLYEVVRQRSIPK